MSTREISDEKLREHVKAIMGAEDRLRVALNAKRRAERRLGIPRYRPYWTALGQFVHYFAEVERVLFFALSKFTGTKRSVARIVFSGTRVDAANTHLRGLIVERRLAKWRRSEILQALDQLSVINKARNDILHHGTDGLDPKRLIISNMTRAKSKDALREFEITPQALEDMARDSISVAVILETHVLGGKSSIDREFPIEWRYKPPSVFRRDQHTIDRLVARRQKRKSVV